ncbi:hypothetical protein TNCV_3463971 [Trichonephila clavipes]|nr:hypothetical protein TNCV_3463971 [Trichonephila clavipes]
MGSIRASTPWFKITWPVVKSPRVAEQFDVNIHSLTHPALVVQPTRLFGPSELTSTYSVCTRKVFSGIGHRTQAFRSVVRCSNHHYSSHGPNRVVMGSIRASTPWFKITWSVAKSPRVAEQ